MHAAPKNHHPTPVPLGSFLVFIVLVIIGLLCYAGIANPDPDIRLLVTLAACGTLFVLKYFKRSLTLRAIFLVVAFYLSVNYFYWRCTSTIGAHDVLSLIAALLILFAEFYGFAITALSYFININPRRRKILPLPEDTSRWPTVDVFIPTYNEDQSIIENTVLAARQIDYPADKLRIYLLDDGGTDQQCNHPDPARAARARARREAFSRFCLEAGVTYVAREKNVHAKAGNLNAGLQHSSGELVLVLDADHVPTRDILKNTVGWFVADPKMFLVQTPHFLGNPDPVEKNLQTFAFMPSENEMFYHGIQRGLDFWNSSFFCGSAAVLRRACLAEVKGFSGESITEDAETAITLHARGYHSAYIDVPMVNGLATETVPSFITQRIRWAQGMLQIFMLKNPVLLRGLTLPQRLCYTANCFFWFFPLVRMIFLAAPLFFLCFGLKVYDTNWQDFLLYAVPHLYAIFTASHYLFGRLRWTCISEVYEIIQSAYTLPVLFGTLFKPRGAVFKVTNKGEVIGDTHVSPYAKPYYVFLALNLVALAAGVYRLLNGISVDSVAITMFWASFNCVLLFICLGVMVERNQPRNHPRLPASYPCRVRLGERVITGVIKDLSNGGARVSLRMVETQGADLSSGVAGVIEVDPSAIPSLSAPLSVPVILRGTEHHAGGLFARIQFNDQTLEEKMRRVRLVYGESARWAAFQSSRRPRKTIFGCLSFILACSIRSLVVHLAHAVLHTEKEPEPRRTASAAATDTVFAERQRAFRVN
jgi:cellulose synthase (UDP-forming)